ncbi:MAG: alpha-glucosidase/alpha-galactosidase [Pseudomonadota bacterium]
MSHPKIVFVGAGSTVFAKNLLGDLLSFAALANSTIALYDIDAERLKTSEIVARKIAATLGVTPTIESTLDRRAAFAGADYIISMFQVGGYEPSTVIDFDLPRRAGVPQTIADTLGIGGIMRALRTIPVFESMLRDMEALCPQALHLNYVNPMAMNCWAMQRQSSVRTIGLCHSVQHTAKDLANDIGVPVDEIDYLCAGINHMAFYLRFERNGEDLYPRLREVAAGKDIPYRGSVDRADGGVTGLSDRVRYRMLQELGYFVTESSEHFAEYVPWFIKAGRADLIAQFEIPLDEYIRRCKNQLAGWHALREKLEDPTRELRVRPSDEYGATIVHAMHTGEAGLVYANVPNTQPVADDSGGRQTLIDNLPADCVVEVPCEMAGGAFVPQAVGRLPPQLAALMQTNINPQALTVEAAVTGEREHIYHAAMLDPLTAALLSLDEIHELVDALIAAHGDYLPESLRA